ncbi:MAG: hypothetical protein H0U43_05930 [Chthoniobacterales bacterium]|nr:hypothetical protein [Chthoniobacterales bacterium]
MQFIDARDVAEWTIRMVENGETRIYNATGPAEQLGVGSMLDGIKAALKSDSSFTWVSAEFLEEQKVVPWMEMPVWVPPASEDGALSRTGIKKALGKGLTFRSLDITARDTLAWFKSQPAERQAQLHAGITAEREAEVLAAWKKQQQG